MQAIRTYFIKYFLSFLLIYLALLGSSHLPPIRKNLKDFARTKTGQVLNTTLPKAIFIADPQRLNLEESSSLITLAYANRAALDAQRKQQQVVAMDFQVLNYELDQIYLTGLFFFLALVLVTPISWQRKIIGILIGGALLFLINTFVISVLALEKVADSKIGIYDLSAGSLKIVTFLGNLFNNAIVFVVPVFVWAIVCFKRGDLKLLFPTSK
ncbi:MAG: hypothetical protein HC892_07640 [Saprospiraceae bacterium]|nr:hypothetical protein [Saprospiraceae bacterium]